MFLRIPYPEALNRYTQTMLLKLSEQGEESKPLLRVEMLWSPFQGLLERLAENSAASPCVVFTDGCLGLASNNTYRLSVQPTFRAALGTYRSRRKRGPSARLAPLRRQFPSCKAVGVPGQPSSASRRGQAPPSLHKGSGFLGRRFSWRVLCCGQPRAWALLR